MRSFHSMLVTADARSPQITELRSRLNTESQCPFTAHHDGGGTDAANGGRELGGVSCSVHASSVLILELPRCVLMLHSEDPQCRG